MLPTPYSACVSLVPGEMAGLLPHPLFSGFAFSGRRVLELAYCGVSCATGEPDCLHLCGISSCGSTENGLSRVLYPIAGRTAV